MNTGLGHLIPAVLYGVFLLACAASILWRPQIGLYVLVPVLPLQTTRMKLVGFPFGENLIFLLLFSILLGAIPRYMGDLLPRCRLNKWVLVLALYTFCSLWYGSFASSLPLPLWISDPRFSAYKDYMAMPLLYLATSAVLRDRRQIRWMLLLMCVSMLAVNYSAVREIASHDFSHFDENKRNGGPLGYAGANGLAVFEAEVLLFLLALFRIAKHNWTKIGLLLLIATCFYCVTFSFSREAYLALLIGLTAFSVLRQRKMLVAITLFLLFSSVLLPTAVKERIAGTTRAGSGLDLSSQERVELWTDAMQLLQQNPILGYGFNTYRFMNRVANLQDTHNVYVKIAVEGGIVGLLIFLLLLVKMGSEGYAASRSSDDLLASLGLALFLWVVCAAVANFFGDRWTYIEISGFLWVLAAMLNRYKTFSLQEEPGDRHSALELNWPADITASALPSTNACAREL